MLAQREDGIVAPEDWPIVNVFLACLWSYMPMGMGRPIPVGIAAVEIAANCHLLRIPAQDRPEISAGVRLMVAAALPILREAGAH